MEQRTQPGQAAAIQRARLQLRRELDHGDVLFLRAQREYSRVGGEQHRAGLGCRLADLQVIRAADGAQIARFNSREAAGEGVQARIRGVNLRQRQPSAFCCLQQGVIGRLLVLARVREEHRVGTSQRRQHRRLARPVVLSDSLHLHAVGDDQALEPDLLAQQAADGRR